MLGDDGDDGQLAERLAFMCRTCADRHTVPKRLLREGDGKGSQRHAGKYVRERRWGCVKCEEDAKKVAKKDAEKDAVAKKKGAGKDVRKKRCSWLVVCPEVAAAEGGAAPQFRYGTRNCGNCGRGGPRNEGGVLGLVMFAGKRHKLAGRGPQDYQVVCDLHAMEIAEESAAPEPAEAPKTKEHAFSGARAKAKASRAAPKAKGRSKAVDAGARSSLDDGGSSSDEDPSPTAATKNAGVGAKKRASKGSGSLLDGKFRKLSPSRGLPPVPTQGASSSSRPAASASVAFKPKKKPDPKKKVVVHEEQDDLLDD